MSFCVTNLFVPDHAERANAYTGLWQKQTHAVMFPSSITVLWKGHIEREIELCLMK